MVLRQSSPSRFPQGTRQSPRRAQTSTPPNVEAAPDPIVATRRQSPRLVVAARRQSPRFAHAAPPIVTTEVAIEGLPDLATEVPTKRDGVVAMPPRVVEDESDEEPERQSDRAAVVQSSINDVPVAAGAARPAAHEAVVNPYETSDVAMDELGVGNAAGSEDVAMDEPGDVGNAAVAMDDAMKTTELASDAERDEKTAPVVDATAELDAMETTELTTELVSDADRAEKPVPVKSAPTESSQRNADTEDEAMESPEETTESTTKATPHVATSAATDEPMAQLAQLAVDVEARASGTPRRRVTPPVQVAAMPALTKPDAKGRTTRSKSHQFFASLDAQREKLVRKRVAADHKLAVKLAKEEERELGLLSASTVDSDSELESVESQFGDSPHIADAKGRSGSEEEDEDTDLSDKSPPRKTPRYSADQTASQRGAASGKAQSKKPAKKARSVTKISHSVTTKPSRKRKKTTNKRAREAASNSDTDSDVITSAAQSAESAEDEASSEEDAIPSDILGYMSDEENKGRGKFMKGFPEEFPSWEEIDARLPDFQDETYQLFKKRTGTNVITFNKNSKDYQIPLKFKKYAQTWKCTHAMKTQKKTKKKKKTADKPSKKKSVVKVQLNTRKRRFVRFTGCTAVLNATVVPRFKGAKDEKDFVIRWTATGGHNHALSAQLYSYYPENRLRRTPGLIAEIQKALGYGGDAVNILHRLREDTGDVILGRDVHNLIAWVKRQRVLGTTVEDRLNTTFREFELAAKGNWAKTFVNPETKEAQSIVFQSARMRRLFNAFPEVVMVDCTHSTNKNHFVLFSFVIHDVFGKGQYVNHSLMYRETIDNMTDAVLAFKKHNPRWRDIRCFIVDKDFKERTVLRLHFPQARILLCHYHVIKYLAKKVKELVRGTKREKDELIHICRALVYAKTPAIYDATVMLLQKKLGALMNGDDDSSPDSPDEQDVFSEEPSEDEDEEEIKLEDDDEVSEIQARAVRDAQEDAKVKRGKKHSLFKYFVKNWESCKEEWVYFHRQNVAHLGNETNNRIEAKWGQMKRVVDVKMDMEEAVRTILSMQSVSEDEYLVELKNPGTRVVHDPDPELVQLLHHVSDHAYALVKPEYVAVKNKIVNYKAKLNEGNAVLTRSDDGEAAEYTIRLDSFTCSCFFAQVRLLPCRHVFFYRTFKNCESVIPIKFINLRWSVLNATNDISVGDPDPATPLRGRYAVTDATSTHTSSLSQGDKFCKVMSVFRPIAAAMSKQPPALFDRMYEFLTGIESMMQRGEVPALAAEYVEDAPRPDEIIEEAPGYQSLAVQRREAEAKAKAKRTKREKRAAQAAAKAIADKEEAESIAGDREDTSFVLPSHAQFSSARRDLRAAGAQEMLKSVTKEAEKFLLKTDRKQASAPLSEVQAVVETGCYNYFEAIQLVCGIPILETKTKSNLVPRRDEHVIADSTTVRFVLTEPVIKRLLADFKNYLAESDEDENERIERVVAVGDGKGFLSIAQLKTMDAYMEAIARVNAVVIATEWIYRKQKKTDRVEFPFDTFGSALSEKYVDDTVEALHYMPLGVVEHPYDTAAGADLMEIASNDWLHTTSILAILSCLTRIKPGIAIVTPDFVHTKDDGMRQRMLVKHGAFAPEAKWIISIVNVTGNHWTAFFIDKKSSTCTLYDPLASSPTAFGLKTLQKLVDKNVDPLLPTRLTYRTFTEMTQDDGSSCGVYSAVFLEIFLHGCEDARTFPTSTALFRMRYMRLVAALMKLHDNAADAVLI